MAGKDSSNLGFAILCFFFPLVGLILYLVWKDEYPLRAKSCGKGAIVGFILSAVFTIIYIIVIVLALVSGVPTIAVPLALL